MKKSAQVGITYFGNLLNNLGLEYQHENIDDNVNKTEDDIENIRRRIKNYQLGDFNLYYVILLFIYHQDSSSRFRFIGSTPELRSMII